MSVRPPVSIDEELCVGHGRCYALQPRIFYPDDMGRGHVNETVDFEPSPTDLARVIDACPEGAITLTSTLTSSQED